MTPTSVEMAARATARRWVPRLSWPHGNAPARDLYALSQHFNVRTFAVLAVAFTILYAPIMIANRPLLDDMARDMHGGLNLLSVGRPLGYVLINALNLGAPIVAVYMLNQIIAVICLAAAGTILAAIYNTQRPLLAAIAAFPLGGNPYFLENISWNFDSPAMAAGMLAAMAAAGTLTVTSTFVWAVVAPILIFCSLSLYQPSVNVFFIAAAFVIAKRWSKMPGVQPTAGHMIVRAAIATLAALTAYFILLKALPMGGYAEQHSQLCNFGDGCRVALENLQKYWQTMWDDWGLGPLAASTYLTIAIGLVVSLFGGPRTGNRAPLALRPAAIAVLVVVVICQYGFNLLFAEPVWCPRTYVSFGAVSAVAALAAVAFARECRGRLLAGIIMVPLLVMDFSMLVVAHAVGAVASAQKEFEASLLSRIIFDIEQLPVIDGLGVIGVAPTSPVMEHTASKFPFVPALIQNPIEGDWDWGNTLFALHGLDLKPVPGSQFQKMIEDGDLKPTLKRRTYCVYVSDTTAIVLFRQSAPGC